METGKHTSLAANVPAWSSRSTNMPSVAEEEMSAEVDEPPDHAPCRFQKTSVRKPCDVTSSLLTRALLSNSDDEALPDGRSGILLNRQRRRSMTSNISLASTADLTSDTGLTSPSRADTPSPPPPEMRTLAINDTPNQCRKLGFALPPALREQTTECAPRKKSITFACFAKPEHTSSEPEPRHPQLSRPPTTTNAKPDAQRKPTIKFACPGPALRVGVGGKPASTSARRHRSPRPPIFRQHSKEGPHPSAIGTPQPHRPALRRPEEFTYDEPKEDDWIREECSLPKRRITIGDTLLKENHIRQLAREAEEEDEEEGDENPNAENDDEDDEEEDDGEDDEEDGDDDEEDDEDDDDEDDNEDEDETEYSFVEADAGYHTDEETGFADSEEDDEDGLHLWNHGIRLTAQSSPGGLCLPRRLSATDHHSDSSAATGQGESSDKPRKPRRIANRPVSPELPDSTDFVCGTFDEDRQMEEAYFTRRAALKAQRRHIIPQDIDPSFPTSDVEDGDGEELFNPVHHDGEDELWKMEDVVGGQDRTSRKKAKGASPKRYHSPPPKARGRSPRNLDRHSPRRMRSPCPKRIPSTGVSPTNGANVKFAPLGVRAGLTHTKSLPRRPGAIFALAKHGKKAKVPASDHHVRGAIDIVKGLEQKRQRRKEKFYKKYCSRARKGQNPERKALPGLGATKMRELGLLMAGKTDRGNYVMSV